jgi:hypothetical protein
MTNFNTALTGELIKMKSLGIWIPPAVMQTAETLCESRFGSLSVSQIADLLMTTRGKI